MQNIVAAHFRDGKIIKGTTNDFAPMKPAFHVVDCEKNQLTEIAVDDLKAIFFVKDLEGDNTYNDCQDAEQKGLGQKIVVRFKDGELITGYTNGYAPTRKSFFVFPADANSNNIRVLVMKEATTEVKLLTTSSA